GARTIVSRRRTSALADALGREGALGCRHAGGRSGGGRTGAGGRRGAGPPFTAAARRLVPGDGVSWRRSATWRRVSSVCWWCCTDWRSSAPRCHVTHATIAATRAITPRGATADIATIPPNLAAIGSFGPRRLPRRNLQGGRATHESRRQNWGMAGNA